MNTIQRHYNVKNIDMLITAATIVESAIANKEFLISKRATWQDPFFDDLKNRIDNAIQNIIGIDSAKDLRQATQTILNIQANALKDLAIVKVQITEDFKADKTRQAEILNQLGFTTYYKDTRNRDQEALINLLFRFKTNLTPTLKTEIVAKGTAAEALDNIIAHADVLKEADVNQETFKGIRKTITAASQTELNEIYDQTISISKIAGKLFKDQPTVKDQFSFRKVSKTLNTTPKKPEANS